MERLVRTTLRVPEDVWRKLKVIAVSHDATANGLIVELIRRFIREYEEGRVEEELFKAARDRRYR